MPRNVSEIQLYLGWGWEENDFRFMPSESQPLKVKMKKILFVSIVVSSLNVTIKLIEVRKIVEWFEN